MKRRTPTAVFISGRGSNMEALLRASQSPAYSAEIVAVMSNRPDAKGLETARAYGIEAMSFDHRQFATREAFEQVVDGYCRDRQVEIIACAGFMRVMTEGFAARWLGRMINIHPSLLPSYRGLDTHARALTEGVRIHGCTVHFVTGDLDAGPIIAQAAVPVFEHDTVHTLAQRVLVQEHVLYPLVLDWVASGAVTLQSNKVSYAFPPPDEFEPLFSPSASR